ncbi:sensor histidine kinase [Glycomyces tritici]|uniref:histidine kinase n=1 Tax=Glycomyces tritici TaxID=2665176 RepID=A0ABT7YQC5_9ACTN|nr:histidine kinase [Glycomyces tritici]MDN3240815.1 histidine kinase [Glycomyces tritici]
MRQLLRPFRGPAAPLGWTHAFLAAAAASLVGVPVAAVLALAWPGPVPGPVLAVVGCAAVAAAGLPKASRRAAVRTANRLLRAGLPEPLAPRRLSTAAWFLLWAFSGAVLMLATAIAFVGMALPAVWLDGGETVTILVPVEVRPGAAGAWTAAVAAGLLIALIYCAAAYAAFMRRLAARLLGPGLAERLAAAEEEARRVASRNRLARELHDAIGHTLTTSTIQAAVARQVLESDPASARLALTAIEESSRSALDDLDRALGALREEPAPVTAAPTLADLAPLCERAAAAGAAIAVQVDGEPESVAPAVSREAYRIAQEGITNALRHAPGAAVEVAVDVGEDRLGLRVANPVTGGGGSGYGRGLEGMAERVRLLGGTVEAGRDAEDRWVLEVTLPLRPGKSASLGGDRESSRR